jgi:hypothetical protein
MQHRAAAPGASLDARFASVPDFIHLYVCFRTDAAAVTGGS